MANSRLYIYPKRESKIKRKYPELSLRMIIFFLLINSFSEQNLGVSNEAVSEIHLIIEGNGIQQLIKSDFPIEPSSVLVNGVEDISCNKTCYLEGERNRITLRFSGPIEYFNSTFQGLQNIIEADLSNFDASNCISMKSLFQGCINLQRVNFGNMNTSALEDMTSMFERCRNLISIDLSNFNTSKVKSIESLFNLCSRLISIDISNFDTSEVTNMDWMFNDCTNLEIINFGNINTSSVESMELLFKGCSKLTTIDLSKFDTSKVTNMNGMFRDCSSLIYLNLSNFKTSEVLNMNRMFEQCSSLIYLNLALFQIKDNTVNLNRIFNGLSGYVSFCIRYDDTKNYLLEPYHFSSETDNCYKKIDITDKICLDSCLDSTNNKFEYRSICYNKCPRKTLLNDYMCLVNECENGNQNIDECLDGKPIGYYLDSIDQVYKKCFEKCKFCYGKGNETNHNCIECKFNFTLLNDSIDVTKCYQKCEYYYYFDELGIYHCTETNTCPNEYNKFIKEKNKCIDQCEKIIYI